MHSVWVQLRSQGSKLGGRGEIYIFGGGRRERKVYPHERVGKGWKKGLTVVSGLTEIAF